MCSFCNTSLSLDRIVLSILVVVAVVAVVAAAAVVVEFVEDIGCSFGKKCCCCCCCFRKVEMD